MKLTLEIVNGKLASLFRELKEKNAFYSIYELTARYLLICNHYSIKADEYEYFLMKYDDSPPVDSDLSIAKLELYILWILEAMEKITGENLPNTIKNKLFKTNYEDLLQLKQELGKKKSKVVNEQPKQPKKVEEPTVSESDKEIVEISKQQTKHVDIKNFELKDDNIEVLSEKHIEKTIPNNTDEEELPIKKSFIDEDLDWILSDLDKNK